MGGGRPTDSGGIGGDMPGSNDFGNSMPKFPGEGIPTTPGVTLIPVPYGDAPAPPPPPEPTPTGPSAEDTAANTKSVEDQVKETETDMNVNRRIRGRASTYLSKSGLGDGNISRRTLLGS